MGTLIRNIVLLSVLFVLYAQGDEKKVSIQLLWKHQFEFAGYYMAKEKGFYRNVGLDVEIKEYDFGTNIAKDVSMGISDFGVDSSSLILDKIQGLDVYLLMPTLQTSPFILLSKERDDLKTVSDLKGKKIMVTPNQVTMASLNAMFKVNNISNKDFISQKHSFNIQDLIDGKTDAITAYISNEPFFMIEKNIKYTVLNPSDFGFDFYDNILFTSKKLLKKDPELVKNFYEASKRGWEYAYNNIEETAKIIQDKYNTQHKSLEHLIYEGTELKKLSHFGANEYAKFKPEIISQIIQTYNLLDISKSTVDTKELIYPDAMYVENGIDYTLLLEIVGVILVLFIGFYYWNRKLSYLNKAIQKSRNKIAVLLDNAGQGFLTFDTNFIVDDEYSKECIKILGEDIASHDITDLLFSDSGKKEFFKNTLKLLLPEKNEIKRKSLISLLPQIILLNKKAIRIEYKVLDESYFMLILTNITSQKKLENKVKKEQETLKMIVAIVSEPEMFFDLKKEYIDFINSFDKQIDLHKTPLHNISNIYRIIHTFKGTFAQLYIQNIVTFLHNLESEISHLQAKASSKNEELLELLENCDFRKSLDVSVNIIKEVLGEEFLESDNFVKIDYLDIVDLQEKIENVLGKIKETTPECYELLCQVQNLSSTKLITLLHPFIASTKQLALRLEKEIYDFEIIGDNNFTLQDKYKPCIKSLIHIFRNCVDHGIEKPDIRVEKGKDEFGTIVCNFVQEDENLIIIISDDGAGIDIERLKIQLEEKNIETKNLSDNGIYQFIFNDNFTTKETVSEISGRGVGMSVVKNEVDKLNGVININSQKDSGTTFEIVIPLS
jgi:two-component system chemotaxis sensor kinase CheA